MADPWILDRTEVHYLVDVEDGRFSLAVALPESYETATDRTYPVVYIEDGNWDFISVYALYGNLIYDNRVPEYILVGVGYGDYENMPKNRLIDQLDRPDHFLQVLEHQIIPFVDNRFRTATEYRVIGGASSAASFALHALFTKPSLFQGYMVIAPTDLRPLELEANFASKADHPGVRLFLGCGTEDAEAEHVLALLVEQLELHAHPNLSFEVVLVEQAHHASVKAEGYNRGLAFTLNPLLKAV